MSIDGYIAVAPESGVPVAVFDDGSTIAVLADGVPVAVFIDGTVDDLLDDGRLAAVFVDDTSPTSFVEEDCGSVDEALGAPFSDESGSVVE